MFFPGIRRVLTGERFRWVSCQLDSLRKCLRPGTVRKTLNTLPSTLDETYERILLNIDDQYKQEAQVALTWLVASRCVLTVGELAEAISIEIDSKDPFDPANRLFEPSTICDVLSGLVSPIQSNQNVRLAKIRLAHFSVEEYLVSDRLAESRASHFHIPFIISHIKLAAASLIYLQWAKDFVKEEIGRQILSVSDIVTGDLHEEVPLLGYACDFWCSHVRICEGHLPEREIRLVKDFLECQERISIFEIRTYGELDNNADEGCHSSRQKLLTRNPFNSKERMRAEPDFIASPLYHAARLGLVDLVTALLEEIGRTHVSLQSLAFPQPMHQNTTPGTFGDELRVACFYGRREIVEILLNAGADVAAVGGAFITAMGACMQSETPNPDIIQMLLESVDILHPDVEWNVGWVLRWAAIEGHLDVISTLMSKVDCVQPSTYSWTQDYFRSHDWKHRILPRYRRKDIEGTESYPKHGTAPYEAASGGHYEILSLLISNWSDIDEVDYEGRTSLYWAVFNGHTETVRLLLQNGARTHGHRNVHEWTPAYWACMRGFHEIEELLANGTSLE